MKRRAMFIAVTNQKGGVGKSTIAVHIAAWFSERGFKTVAIDADPQHSAVQWLRQAAPDIDVEAIHDPDALIQRAKSLRENGVDIVVADGPPGLAELTRALLLVADLAVIPCGPSLLEVEAASSALNVVSSAMAVRNGSPEVLVVLNRLGPDRYVLSREVIEATRHLGVPCAKQIVRLRQAIADAPGQRTLVWKMGKQAESAVREVSGLMREIEATGKRQNLLPRKGEAA